MFEEKLIEEIKKYPCIYNKALKTYKIKQAAALAWVEISKACGQSEKECRTRWRSLRDRFVKETRTEYVASGSSPPTKKKAWIYLEAMQFLKDHIEPRAASSSIESSEKQLTSTLEIEELSASEMSEFLMSSTSSSFQPTVEVTPRETLSSSTPLPSPTINVPYLFPNESSSSEMVPSPTPGRPTKKNTQIENQLSSVFKEVRELINEKKKELEKKNTSDENCSSSFTSMLEQFAKSLPENKRYEYEMKVLNYAYQVYEELK